MRHTALSIEGREFDWLAIDAVGHVALLSTAGGGFVPDAALDIMGEYDDAIDAILAFPENTVAAYAPTIPAHLTNTWRLVAERGLYAFDADANGGPYRCVAAPHVAIQADHLPALARSLALRFVLTARRFDEASQLDETSFSRGA